MRRLRSRRSPARLVDACSRSDGGLVPDISVAMCQPLLPCLSRKHSFYCCPLFGLRLRSPHVTEWLGRMSARPLMLKVLFNCRHVLNDEVLKWREQLTTALLSRRWGLSRAAHAVANSGCLSLRQLLCLAARSWVLLHHDYTDSRFPGKPGTFSPPKPSGPKAWNPQLSYLTPFFLFLLRLLLLQLFFFWEGGWGGGVHPAIDTLDPGGTASIIETLSSPFERDISDFGPPRPFWQHAYCTCILNLVGDEKQKKKQTRHSEGIVAAATRSKSMDRFTVADSTFYDK